MNPSYLVEEQREGCGYCHGVRLVGWSGAGPILCPECSRGKDAFTVVTQAWREQRTMVKVLIKERDELKAKLNMLTETCELVQEELEPVSGGSSKEYDVLCECLGKLYRAVEKAKAQ